MTSQEARWLIGWWLNKGSATPHKSMSAWGREARYASQFWGPQIRQRIASQVDAIRHWRVACAPYLEAGEGAATWFIDPPYDSTAGTRYPHRLLDYELLSRWARGRSGQVIVCEQAGASWLPFTYLHDAKVTSNIRRPSRYSAEAIWTNTVPSTAIQEGGAA